MDIEESNTTPAALTNLTADIIRECNLPWMDTNGAMAMRFDFFEMKRETKNSERDTDEDELTEEVGDLNECHDDESMMKTSEQSRKILKRSLQSARAVGSSRKIIEYDYVLNEIGFWPEINPLITDLKACKTQLMSLVEVLHKWLCDVACGATPNRNYPV